MRQHHHRRALTITPALIPALLFLQACEAQSRRSQSEPTRPSVAATATSAVPELDIQQANALVDQVYVAWNDLRNPEAAARFYAKDPDLVFIDPSPPVMGYRGWTNLQQQIRQNVTGKLSALELRRTADVVLEQRGPVAWAVFPFSYGATDRQGRRTSIRGRHTIIWENRGGEWLIVHEHPSVPIGE